MTAISLFSVMCLGMNVFLIMELRAQLLPGQCPELGKIEPCVCVDEAFYSLHCANVSNVSILNRLPLIFTEGSIRSINLTSSNLPYFPTRILRLMAVNYLYLQRNNFDDLFDITDRLTGHVRHLVVRHISPKNGWNWEQFRTFSNLRILVVYSCDVGGKITASFSQYVTKDIESLNLIDTGITSIEEEAFSRYKNLIHLRLSRNNLHIVQRESLPSPCQLTLLRLDNNAITAVPDDSFREMPELNDIRLGYNDIGIISQTAFSRIWRNNVSLDLQGNPIKCDCSMEWTLESLERPKLLHGVCHHPKALYGKDLKSISLADLNCSRRSLGTIPSL